MFFFPFTGTREFPFFLYYLPNTLCNIILSINGNSFANFQATIHPEISNLIHNIDFDTPFPLITTNKYHIMTLVRSFLHGKGKLAPTWDLEKLHTVGLSSGVVLSYWRRGEFCLYWVWIIYIYLLGLKLTFNDFQRILKDLRIQSRRGLVLSRRLFYQLLSPRKSSRVFSQKW